jgi:3-hydroxyisobutyrate dehydrogenase-like beta-hydroxyacid dehydrogenase
MCRRTIQAGGVGQGQALKVLLNGVGAHHFVAFASMLVLGERAGVPREALVDAFTSGAFASPSYVGKRAKVLARDYSSEFSLDLALKDVSLNVALQKEVGFKLPVVREIVRALKGAVAAGFGAEDLFAIEKWFAGGTKRRARAKANARATTKARARGRAPARR